MAPFVLLLAVVPSPAQAIASVVGAPIVDCGGKTWDIVQNIGSGVHSYSLYQARQSLEEVLREEDILIALAWDHQGEVTGTLQDIEITGAFQRYAWTPQGFMPYWNVETRSYFDGINRVGPCEGIIINTGTSYLGEQRSYEFAMAVEQYVTTYSNLNEVSITASTFTSKTLTAEVAVTVGTETSTETSFSDSRTYGQEWGYVHTSGAAVAITPTLWLAHASADFGGGGLKKWAEETKEHGGIPDIFCEESESGHQSQIVDSGGKWPCTDLPDFIELANHPVVEFAQECLNQALNGTETCNLIESDIDLRPLLDALRQSIEDAGRQAEDLGKLLAVK